MDPDARKYLMELPQYSLFTAPSEYRVGRGVSRIHPSIVGGTNGTSRSAKPITSSNSFSVFPITPNPTFFDDALDLWKIYQKKIDGLSHFHSLAFRFELV